MEVSLNQLNCSKQVQLFEAYYHTNPGDVDGPRLPESTLLGSNNSDSKTQNLFIVNASSTGFCLMRRIWKNIDATIDEIMNGSFSTRLTRLLLNTVTN